MTLDTDNLDCEIEFVGRNEIYVEGSMTAVEVKVGASPDGRGRQSIHQLRYMKSEIGFEFNAHELPGDGTIAYDAMYEIIKQVRMLADDWVEEEFDCVVTERGPGKPIAQVRAEPMSGGEEQ